MIIIKDSNEDSKNEMRHYMRSRMRSNRGYHHYRTSTSYKDEDGWKEGYKKGYEDACKDMENGELDD